MTEVTNKFYHDAAHGWLAVKMHVIRELGLDGKISKSSFIKGQTIYLEEDIDMPLYIDAQKARGVTVNAVAIDHGKRSIVRNYNIYHAAVDTVDTTIEDSVPAEVVDEVKPTIEDSVPAPEQTSNVVKFAA